MPGTYTAELIRRDESGATRIGEPQSFTPKVLAAAGVPPVDAEARHAFQREVAALQRKVFGAVSALGRLHRTGGSPRGRRSTNRGRKAISAPRRRRSGPGSSSCASASSATTPFAPAAEAVLPGIRQRIQRVVGAFWSTSDPTTTHRRQVEIVQEQFGPANAELVNLVEVQLAGLEAEADAAGVPWTPGRRIPQ